jgi:hypothetical protein
MQTFLCRFQSAFWHLQHHAKSASGDPQPTAHRFQSDAAAQHQCSLQRKRAHHTWALAVWCAQPALALVRAASAGLGARSQRWPWCAQPALALVRAASADSGSQQQSARKSNTASTEWWGNSRFATVPHGQTLRTPLQLHGGSATVVAHHRFSLSAEALESARRPRRSPTSAEVKEVARRPRRSPSAEAKEGARRPQWSPTNTEALEEGLGISQLLRFGISQLLHLTNVNVKC